MGILLKLIGAALTVLAALGYSSAKNLELRARIDKCRSVCTFLNECKIQVECHSRPLYDILDRCSPLFSEGFIECVKREGLAVAAEKYKNELLGGEEERSILAAFAEGFGRGHTDAEVKRCAECVERLKKLTEMLENGVKTECKTRLAVSLSVSLMAVLFFA